MKNNDSASVSMTHSSCKKLLSCISYNSDSSENPPWESFTESEWNDVVCQSVEYKVAPLLYSLITSYSTPDVLPEKCLRILKKSYIGTLSKNSYIYKNLHHYLTLLHDNTIEYILLKGVVLAEKHYKDIGLRPMIDVDILVKENQLQKAQNLFYQGLPKEKHCWFDIDFHWYLDKALSIDMDGVRSRAVTCNIAEVPSTVLSPEDHLLHLCIHCSLHHQYQRDALRALVDIKVAVSCYRSELKWDEVVQRAEEWRVSNSVFLTLLLARDLVGADIPDDVTERMKPASYYSGIYQWAVRTIFSDENPEDTLSKNVWLSLTLKSKRDRVKLITESLFLSEKQLSQYYSTIVGSKHRYILYIKRIIYLIIRYGMYALRFAFANPVNKKARLNQFNDNKRMHEWMNSGRKKTE